LRSAKCKEHLPYLGVSDLGPMHAYPLETL
jgi:hypothetical protein